MKERKRFWRTFKPWAHADEIGKVRGNLPLAWRKKKKKSVLHRFLLAHLQRQSTTSDSQTVPGVGLQLSHHFLAFLSLRPPMVLSAALISTLSEFPYVLLLPPSVLSLSHFYSTLPAPLTCELHTWWTVRPARDYTFRKQYLCLTVRSTDQHPKYPHIVTYLPCTRWSGIHFHWQSENPSHSVSSDIIIRLCGCSQQTPWVCITLTI